MDQLMSGDVVVATSNGITFDGARGGWVVGDTLIADPAREMTLVPALPKLSPVEFKLAFTPQERVAIAAARQTDPVLADAYSVLDDPRLSGVDLNLASTQGLIDYLVALELITEERAAQIKAGAFA